ncbi:hypothetical protein DPMN_183969 [Dreissena polymorpha]|uniref:Uncharacterized protein n=1 Tax=Dreissena polymorpha TaxID=45954 RepID=A0A9D4I435_DREPO|nr:hypothetical protein DPMN_183969 [Dreissena polymorpha]
MTRHYLRTPTESEEWKDIAYQFAAKWQFLHAIGALDGKHSHDEALRRNERIFNIRLSKARRVVFIRTRTRPQRIRRKVILIRLASLLKHMFSEKIRSFQTFWKHSVNPKIGLSFPLVNEVFWKVKDSSQSGCFRQVAAIHSKVTQSRIAVRVAALGSSQSDCLRQVAAINSEVTQSWIAVKVAVLGR